MSRTARFGSRADAALLIGCLLLALLLRAPSNPLRAPIASALRRGVLTPLVSMQYRAERVRHALDSFEARALIADSVALRAADASALESENAQLRRLLGLGARLRWGFVPAQALHSRATAEEFSITLTAGSRAGVRAYSPVIAPDGLVGMVQSVEPGMSHAILYSHPDFRVSAMTVDEGALGIVRAHLGSGAERYLLELHGVPFRTSLTPGALVVSTGLGGTYPRGIPIGTVVREIRTSEGWARTYLVRPAVLPPDVGAVMVLSPERARSGLEGVWAIARLDSASRAVAVAGDSVIRAGGSAGARGGPAPAAATRDSGRIDTAARSAPASAALTQVQRDSLRLVRAARARRDSIRREQARRDSADARAAPVRDSVRGDSLEGGTQ